MLLAILKWFTLCQHQAVKDSDNQDKYQLGGIFPSNRREAVFTQSHLSAKLIMHVECGCAIMASSAQCDVENANLC